MPTAIENSDDACINESSSKQQSQRKMLLESSLIAPVVVAVVAATIYKNLAVTNQLSYQEHSAGAGGSVYNGVHCDLA